jgi:2-dehydropantoate 2-reductase
MPVRARVASPEFLVFGSGAIGCLLAARLARAGGAVTIAGTWTEALDAIREKGIAVEESRASWSAPVRALNRAGPLPLAPVVFVCVKAYQTAEVAPAARRAVRAGGLVVTVQNGRGNREQLLSAPGRGRVALGVTTAGATVLGPGRIQSFPGAVLLDRAADPARVEHLVERLRAAGFHAEGVDDIERHAWMKLAVNCAINPLSALAGLPNGLLASEPELRARLIAAAREVAEVAAAAGTPLDEDAADAALSVARATAGNRSSMLQDVQSGRPTEIDALCGAVCREGAARGVATPVNEGLLRDVLALRAGRPAGRETR